MMHIVKRMTAITVFDRILVFFVNVTGVAANLPVGAMQWEVGFVVVEVKLSPAFYRMAAFTIFTQVAMVRILFAMTAVARGSGFCILLVCFVTTAAGDGCMRTLQGEISIFMSKCQWIQFDNVSFSANVLTMTTFTRCRGDVFNAAVVAGLFPDILVDVFMTVQAKLRLGGFAEL